MNDRFDQAAVGYSDHVQDSIAFAGQEHAYFIRRKADALTAIAQRHFAEPSSLDVADIGCGVGEMEAALKTSFRSVVGLEPSLVSATAAGHTAGPETVGVVNAVNADGRALPLADRSVDLAFTVNVLHHVEPVDRDAVLAEMTRIVRPGGLVVAFEHNPINPLTRLSVARCEFDEGVELLGPRELRRRVAAAGLEPLERRYILFTPFDVAWQHRIEQRLGWLPLGAQHYVAARVPA